MESKKVTILGSTGSIGQSALDVITRYPGRFNVVALGAGKNMNLLAEQIRRFRPQYVTVLSPEEAGRLARITDFQEENIGVGQEGLARAATLPQNDLVLNAVVGAAGLLASLETVRAGIDLALANKESLVIGGPLFEGAAKKSGARILPVDSEHSAIWQCLKAGQPDEVKRIILTASGGPFRDRDATTFREITVAEALAHPTWKMGPKITVDSATLMNKGLELIEAVWLFSVPPEKVTVVIHPQSIVHSMVEFVDSSVVAQMSTPDMRLPIAYALFWPERPRSEFGRLDLTKVGRLDFYPPDENKFPALRLAREAAAAGGTAPAALNAANEIGVANFLDGRIRFDQIMELVDRILVEHKAIFNPALDDILTIDRETRRRAGEIVRGMA